MKKSLFIISAAFLVSAFTAQSVFAGGTDNTNCKPIFGGGENCTSTAPTSGASSASTSAPQFEIKKFVKNPKTQTYVEDLTNKDPMYSAGDTVSFKLTVKNNASTALSNIIIKDTLPETVEFNGGAGTYDSNKRVLSIALDKLNSNESRDFYVMASVVKSVKYPDGKNVLCSTNSSSITAEYKTATDKVQFCISKNADNSTSVNSVVVTPTPTSVTENAPATTKGGLPLYPPTNATTTPPTGPEDWTLIGLIPTAISGFLLRRKTK